VAEKKIGGRTFSVEPMLALESMVLKARLMKVAAPVLSVLPTILASASEDKERANLQAITAFGELFSKSDPKELAHLVKDICEVASIQRPSGNVERVDFDGDMTGHDGDIPVLAIFVLREQFGDFFAGLRGIGTLGGPRKG
jgi:hypothetical protein